MAQKGGKVILLRHRPKHVKDIISQNLIPLEENVSKKLAQEAYYSSLPAMGNSPMIRELKKEPVHERLGNKQPGITKMRMKRVQFTGTDTSSILPRRRNFKPKLNQRKGIRVYSAQARLERIRQEVYTQNKSIKLRRFGSNTTNYTIQVPNNIKRNQFTTPLTSMPQKFKILLDPVIQKAILEYQLQILAPIPNNYIDPDERAVVHSSQISVNNRFTTYID